jgi:NifU-like protein involved in Fe-S cluster formation
VTAPRGALYTPDLLALAVSLADSPLDPALSLRGEARSSTCGSIVALGCEVDAGGRIERVGVRASACAVGQASTALFVRSAVGRDCAEIAVAREDLRAWLAGSGEAPEWPGLAVLDPARAYPARHGAIVLAWDAALAALSKARAPG